MSLTLSDELQSWVGRTRTVEEDITLGTVRSIAGMLDFDPDAFKNGDALPPHWFNMFFCDADAAERHRPGRPPEARRHPAAHPAAAAHGRGAARADAGHPCASATRRRAPRRWRPSSRSRRARASSPC